MVFRRVFCFFYLYCKGFAQHAFSCCAKHTSEISPLCQAVKYRFRFNNIKFQCLSATVCISKWKFCLGCCVSWKKNIIEINHKTHLWIRPCTVTARPNWFHSSEISLRENLLHMYRLTWSHQGGAHLSQSFFSLICPLCSSTGAAGGLFLVQGHHW